MARAAKTPKEPKPKAPKLRVCKFVHCHHGEKINIDTEEFAQDSIGYYHKDCYQTKCDCELFRNIWKQRISNTVVITQLNKMLYENIERGIESSYLLFALQYVLDNNMKLRYPNGFNYYLDKEEIKFAYKKQQIKKKIGRPQFSVSVDESENETPIIKSASTNTGGFGSILRNK